MVRPPEAPEESIKMDWLPGQNLDMRVSILALLNLVSYNMRMVGVPCWLFLFIIMCLLVLLMPLIFHDIVFID